MTEPIIINGVDVSECEYYDSKMNGVCECKNTKEYGTPTRITGCGGCKFNPNCYYKQLKSKEQECEKYKKFIETVKSRIKGYKESCDEFCQYDRKCCHSCFTGGAIELGEDIEMDISEVENV